MTRPPVVIREYDSEWPRLFEEEKAAILDAIGHVVAAIEHVGSTAVPGLAAKPIIDIMVGVRRLADAQQCIVPLQRIGYEYVPEFEVSLPERRYFRKGSPRTHHLHTVEVGSDFWERHLLFRDHLRAHPEAAKAYGELKRDLAVRYGADREAYTEAKTPFIRAAEDLARRSRLADEASKLDPNEERALAEEGLPAGAESWPEY